MKKKAKIIVSLTAVAAIAVSAGLYFGLSGMSSSDDSSTIYVQKVSDITGSSYTSNRYSGIVESQEKLDISQDSSKTIAEVYVSEGQEVHIGDSLFSYDVSESQNKIQSNNLDIEAQNNEISARNNEITDYNKQMKEENADTTEIQAKINDANYAIRQASNQIKVLQSNNAQLQKEINNATVTSTIDGIIQEVNPEGGTDTNGNAKPIVSITQTGEFRVKGTLTEMGLLSEGSSVIIRSRIDETAIWKGTVTKVETEPQTDSNTVYYSSSSSDTASKYPFYVTLDSAEGLMLGQHVYIEVDDGQTSVKEGLWLDSSFISYDEEGNPFVWVSEKDKLKKRSIEIGSTDETTYTTEILSGLSEDDYIAWADDSYTEGMKTTSDLTGGE